MAPTSAPRLTVVSSAHLRSVVSRGGAKEWVSRCVTPAAPKWGRGGRGIGPYGFAVVRGSVQLGFRPTAPRSTAEEGE